METRRNKRDEAKIGNLEADIRENAKLFSKLRLGTPIILSIKARIEMPPKFIINNGLL